MPERSNSDSEKNLHQQCFGLGNVGDPAPSGFIAKEQAASFLSLPFPFAKKVIGKPGCLGVRYVIGFFAVDVYKYSDQEPFIEPYPGLRLVFWHPISETRRKKGWLRNLFIRSGWQYGYARLGGQYWENWSKHARRHRNRWKKSKDCELRQATVDEFEKAFYDSGKLDLMLRTGFMRVARFHEKNHPKDITAMIVFEKRSKLAIAGLVTVDYPEAKQSRHTISFLRKEAQRTSVGYGLIDAWHERSLEKGIEWLDFGVVWRKGNDSSWKKYSAFKRQFGLYLLHFPRFYCKFRLK